MNSYISRPAGAAHGGIILFQEAFGVNDWLKSVADRLSTQGYLVVAPELFHRSAGDGFIAPYGNFDPIRPHLAALTLEGLEEDARAAYKILLDEGVPADQISSLGFCMGGRVSFIANSILPLKYAISFYGSGIDALTERMPNLSGDMLYFWGGRDKHITTDLRRKTLDAMQNANKTFAHVLFSDAEHGFFCDARDAYHKRSAELAWPLVLEFLK